MKKRQIIAAAAMAVAWVAVASGPAHPIAAGPPAETCGGRQVTIPGTNASETLTGTPGPDVIHARAGNDVIRGLSGDDTICPGPGRDAVKGGAGNDTFVADPTPDGSDAYVGDSGLDRVTYADRTAGITVSIDGAANDGETGEGDDVGLSVETVHGGAGDDHLVGSPNSDGLNGLGGDDTLIGGLSADDLNGGDGNDTLRGNAGDDFLDGEDGDDTVVAASSPDGADFVEGGSGTDTASYEFRGQAVRVSLDLLANDGAEGEGDNVQLDIENIEGGSGNDELRANLFQQLPNRLSGNLGSDVISVTDSSGGDIADGGPFNDLCFTNPGDIRYSCES